MLQVIVYFGQLLEEFSSSIHGDKVVIRRAQFTTSEDPVSS
jgi:hypothetical protein